MKIRYLLGIICLMILSCCNSIVNDFDIVKVDYNNIIPISDSMLLLNLILKNDTVSGFSEWTSGVKEKMQDPATYKYARHRFDTCFWNHKDPVFFLLDSVLVGENVGYLILYSYKDFYENRFHRTMYLSMFNQYRKNIKTYIVSQGVEKGDGYIGGGIHSRSELLNNNNLVTYYRYYSYSDCGSNYEDSIVYTYDLINLKTLKIDTIKSIVN